MARHFSCECMWTTLHGGIPDQIPYGYSIPEKYRERVKEKLGVEPEEFFHTDGWYRMVAPKYIGAELWDSPDQTFPQSREEFEMLRRRFERFLPKVLPEDSRIGAYGVATYHPRGTVGHLRRIINPLAKVKKASELEAYPFPDAREEWRWKGLREEVKRQKEAGYLVMGGVPTMLEDANFLRGMEQNLVDMAEDSEVAHAIWDRLAEDRLYIARRYAEMGVDFLGFGDHLAHQHGSLLSREMLRKWVIPRYERAIAEARAIKRDLSTGPSMDSGPQALPRGSRPEHFEGLPCAWHTDGKNDDFIYDELMAIGVNIFNPVEADCEDPHALKEKYGNQIVLWGTMAKCALARATDEEARAMVADRIALARRYGGLLLGDNCIPGEVPFENHLAFNIAAEEYGKR